MTDSDGNQYMCEYVQQNLTDGQRNLCYQQGNLVTDYYGERKILWYKQQRLNLTLTYDGCGRGRSAVTFYWRDQNDTRYPMFLTDLDDMIRCDKARGEVSAEFELVKRGANYGIKLCESMNKKEDETATANKRYCLYCQRSMSADAIDGSQVLVCFDCKGHEGEEMQVDDDGCCDNYLGLGDWDLCCKVKHDLCHKDTTACDQFKAKTNKA